MKTPPCHRSNQQIITIQSNLIQWLRLDVIFTLEGQKRQLHNKKKSLTSFFKKKNTHRCVFLHPLLQRCVPHLHRPPPTVHHLHRHLQPFTTSNRHLQPFTTSLIVIIDSYSIKNLQFEKIKISNRSNSSRTSG